MSKFISCDLNSQGNSSFLFSSYCMTNAKHTISFMEEAAFLEGGKKKEFFVPDAFEVLELAMLNFSAVTVTDHKILSSFLTELYTILTCPLSLVPFY